MQQNEVEERQIHEMHLAPARKFHMLVTQSGHLPKTVGSALAAGSYAAVGGAQTPDSKELVSTTFMNLLVLADTEITASLDLQLG
jgi:hypothetical protein